MDQQEEISIDQALQNVDFLDDFVFDENSILADNISNVPLHYSYNSDCNFADKNAYVSVMSRYMEETVMAQKLNKLTPEFDQLCSLIYQWRPMCRCIPSTVNMEKEIGRKLSKTIIEMFEPRIQILYRLKNFSIMAVEVFIECIRDFVTKNKKNDFVSSHIKETMVKYLALLIKLNYIKLCMSSIKNDFSAYRRATQALIDEGNIPSEESFMMSMYLATNNNIRDDLKALLQEIVGFQDIFIAVLNDCVKKVENDKYILLSEKHDSLLVIGWCIFLLDMTTFNINKMESKKDYSLSHVDKLFKNTEVVSVFVDIPVSTFDIIKDTPNYDALKWPNCNSTNTSPQSVILFDITALRSEYCDFIEKIAIFNNYIITSQKNVYNNDAAENEKIFNYSFNALKLVSKLKSTFIESYFWKMLNPTDHHQNENCPFDSSHYERATRFNYTYQEKSTIVEIIAMIKGLQNMIFRIESILIDGIRRHIYGVSQYFLQEELKGVIKRCVKTKKEILQYFFMATRNSCSDWKDLLSTSQDVFSRGKKQPKEPEVDVEYCDRSCTASSTQLYIMTTLMEAVVDEGKTFKKTLRRHLDSTSISTIESFLESSQYWKQMLTFGHLLREVGDISIPWYREFFLQAASTETIQFPIEMSIPWIMIDHVLESKDGSLMEYIIFCLEMYNDIGNTALNKLKSKCLYDEIEAELNICFVLFVVKLSEQIFQYYRHWASSIMLDKRFRAECAALGTTIPFPKHNRYDKLLLTDNVYLLGRCIDLRCLISEKLNASFLKSLEGAINKFDSTGLSGILELESLIESNRLSHFMLSKYLNMTDFNQLFLEADQRVVVPYGRILTHVYTEISQDLIQNFCFNEGTNRFVRGKIEFGKMVVREKCPTVSYQYLWGTKALTISFNRIFQLYSGFVGVEVFKAICRLLGYGSVAVIVEQLLDISKDLIQVQLSDIVKDMSKVMPKSIKMLRDDYGSSGIFTFYLSQLKDLSRFPNMRTVVLQVFRQVGNCILICRMMEQSLAQTEYISLFHAGPYINSLPPCVMSSIMSSQEKNNSSKVQRKASSVSLKSVDNIMAIYDSIDFMRILKDSSPDQKALTTDVDQIMREKLCCGLSIFKTVLNRLKGIVEETFVGGGGIYSPGILAATDCNQFHRYWSTIQFFFCVPPRDDETNIEQLFGDGIQWAACYLIYLLDQQKRFEATDFSYHLNSINQFDNENGTDVNFSLRKMCCRIRKFKALNDAIFQSLKNYHKLPWFNESENDKTLNSTESSHICVPTTLQRMIPSDDDEDPLPKVAKSKRLKKDFFTSIKTPKKTPVIKSPEKEKIDSSDEAPVTLAHSSYRDFMSRDPPQNLGNREAPKGAENCLSGQSFVITGELESYDRGTIKKCLERHGGVVRTAISGKTNYVVVGRGAGPAKLEKIKKLKIKTLDENGFFDLIEKTKSIKKIKENTSRSGFVHIDPPTKESFKKVLKAKRKMSEYNVKIEKDKVVDQEGLLWVDKYKPTSVSKLVGQHGPKSCANKLIEWLNRWKVDDVLDLPGAALLSGLPGVGKTTTATVVSKELGFESMEMNASDKRSKKLLDCGVGVAISNMGIKSFFSNKEPMQQIPKSVIIMDEVDGMSGNHDRGGVAQLINFIKKTTVPIICICNDASSPKMKSLSKFCLDLKFPRIRVEQIKAHLMSICFKEGFEMDFNCLIPLIEKSDRDIRQCITNLQLLACEKKVSGFDSFYEFSAGAEKPLRMSVFDAARFYLSYNSSVTANSISKKLEYFFNDYNGVPMLIQENYIKVTPFNASSTPMASLKLAADSIAYGDVISNHVRANQMWNLLPQLGFTSSVYPGEIIRGKLGFLDLKFSLWFGKNSTRTKNRRLVKDLLMHTSLKMHHGTNSFITDCIGYYAQKIKQLSDTGDAAEIVNFMESYNISRDDIFSIFDISAIKSVPFKIDTKTNNQIKKMLKQSAAITPYARDDVTKLRKGKKAVKKKNVTIESESEMEESDVDLNIYE